MTTRLGDEDSKAVDLLLDQAARSGPIAMYAAPQSDGFEKRVKSVEKLLNLLDSAPADEPAPDLTARTLQRIDQNGYGTIGPHLGSPPPPQPKHPN